MAVIKTIGKLGPGAYKQMIDHLTRKKIKNPFIKAKDIVVDKKPEVEEREMFNRFNQANPRQDMAGGGMLVQPGFGGMRQGYSGRERGVGKLAEQYARTTLGKKRLEAQKKGLVYDKKTKKFRKKKERGPNKNPNPLKGKLIDTNPDQKFLDIAEKVYSKDFGNKKGLALWKAIGKTKRSSIKSGSTTGEKSGFDLAKKIPEGKISQAELTQLLKESTGKEFKRSIISDIRPGKKNYIANKIRELLNIKSSSFESGKGVFYYFDKPTPEQLEFIGNYIEAPHLMDRTVRNMKLMEKNFGKLLAKSTKKDAVDFFTNEMTIDRVKQMFKDNGVKDITDSKAALAVTRYAQSLQGKLFKNVDGISENSKVGDFIFQAFNSLDKYHPWKQGSYLAVLDDINKNMGKKAGNLSAFKNKFREKMQVLYPGRGFDFNEVFSISTSANRGSYPYAYFVDLTSNAMNQGALSTYQGKASIAEGKIQKELAKFRRTGNKKFYNEAVRVADVFNNQTRKKFLSSEKVLQYQKDYGIKPNALKIEIGSQRQVADKINFASDYFSNKNLQKWKNLGIDIDEHSGRAGYVKTFGGKGVPSNIITAGELFTEDTRLGRKTKVFDEKVLDKFLRNNIAVLGGGDCGRKGKYQGGRIGLQDGTPNVDVCIKNAKQRINSGFKSATPAEARNYTKLLNAVKGSAVIGRNLLKFGIIPEALYVGADSLVRMGFGDTFKEAGLRASDFFIPGDQMQEADKLKVQRTLGNAAATNVGRVFDYRNQIANIDSLEKQKENLANLSDIGEFDYIGDLSQDVKNIDTRLNQAKNDLQNKFMVSEAETVAADRALEEAYDISKAKSPLARLKSFAQNIEAVQDDPFLSDIATPQKTQMDLNLNMFPTMPRDFLTEKTSDLLDRTQYLKSRGFDVSTKDLIAEQERLRSIPLSQDVITYGPEQMYGAQGTFFGQPLAGGGIAKLAGDRSGPPPERGPNSQGLQGLMKRVRNL